MLFICPYSLELFPSYWGLWILKDASERNKTRYSANGMPVSCNVLQTITAAYAYVYVYMCVYLYVYAYAYAYVYAYMHG